MIDTAVQEFGELLGVGSLELSADGSLTLEIEPSDTLCLMRGEGGLLVSLTRAQQYPQTTPASRLLELIHFERMDAPIGLRCRRVDFGRSNVLTGTLPEDGLRGAEILSFLDRLTKLHNLTESV